jgi:hypothetical protein
MCDSDVHLYGKGVGKYLRRSSAAGGGTVWGDKDDSSNWKMEWVSTIRPPKGLALPRVYIWQS